MASIAAIFEGGENPDPCTMAATLETDAANSQAYLIVMNNNVGFTLLHHLQRLDCKTWPGYLIVNRIAASEDDIQPQWPTPNVVVFEQTEDTLFWRLYLP